MALQQDETRTEQEGYDPSEYDEGYTDQEHEDANNQLEEEEEAAAAEEEAAATAA
jgi:hypothetical protein